jgi:hypothetical protein
MAQFARELLALDPKGWTRDALKQRLRADPTFWRQFERNPQAYSGMVRRLILRGDIEERDGLLFASEETQLSVLARTQLFELNRGEFRDE